MYVQDIIRYKNAVKEIKKVQSVINNDLKRLKYNETNEEETVIVDPEKYALLRSSSLFKAKSTCYENN